MNWNETQRSIIDLRDIETAEYVNANDLLEDSSEGVTMQIREGLVLAQKSEDYKYICAICSQPVRLCHRDMYWKDSWFFSHFANSEDCPVKTTSEVSPSRWTEIWQQKFHETKLHKVLLEYLANTLGNSGFSNIHIKKEFHLLN